MRNDVICSYTECGVTTYYGLGLGLESTLRLKLGGLSCISDYRITEEFEFFVVVVMYNSVRVYTYCRNMVRVLRLRF